MKWRSANARAAAVKHLAGLPAAVWYSLVIGERNALWDIVFGIDDMNLIFEVHHARSGTRGPSTEVVECWLLGLVTGESDEAQVSRSRS